MNLNFCEECLKDPDVFCKRNADVKCLDCGAILCGGHIIQHLKKHCISLKLDYCSSTPTKHYIPRSIHILPSDQPHAKEVSK